MMPARKRPFLVRGSEGDPNSIGTAACVVGGQIGGQLTADSGGGGQSRAERRS